MRIVDAHQGAHFAAVRALFEEYAQSLDFSLSFQDFDDELSDLPGKYAPPTGCMLALLHDDEVAGCVALRPLENGICEMKRMYVRPAYRGLQMGRVLAEAVIAKGGELGYRKMRLDTIDSMTAARSLYSALGFSKIEPYCYNPIAGVVYMELNLP